MITVFVVAGIRLYREGLAQELAKREGVKVIGVHAGGPEAVPHIVDLHPDVTLLDMGTSQSHTVARDLLQKLPDLAIVALSITDSETQLLSCAEDGIIGYVTDEASLDDLVGVIQRAARGEATCSPKLARGIVGKLAALAANRQPDLPHPQLTKREREVVALLEQDLSNKEIASRLGVEVPTVKNHVHNLLDKLSVHRRSEIIRLLKHIPRPVAAVPARDYHRRGRSGRSS